MSEHRFAPGDAVVVSAPRHDTTPTWHRARGRVVRIDTAHDDAYIVSVPRNGVNVDVMFYGDELGRAS